MNDESWRRLGEHLVARRIELGFKQRRSFAAARGFKNDRVLADLENAARTNFSAATFAEVERAYEWQVGTVREVLDGGDPTPRDVDAVGAHLDALAALQGWLDARPRRTGPPPTISLQLYEPRQLAGELTRQVEQMEELIATMAQDLIEADAQTSRDASRADSDTADELAERRRLSTQGTRPGGGRDAASTREDVANASYPPATSRGHAQQDQQDADATAPDAPGPEHGA